MVKLAGDAVDEIEQFENMRCIGSLEACARIFSLPQSERFPSVQQLTVHLPGEQNVLFEEGEGRSVLNDHNKLKTELQEFFTYNKRNPGTMVKYCDFPEFYRWKGFEKEWVKRTIKTGTIGRLYTVHPSSGDQYYLRLLLHHNISKGNFSESFICIKDFFC